MSLDILKYLCESNFITAESKYQREFNKTDVDFFEVKLKENSFILDML